MGVTIVLMLVLVCCEGPRRTFPANIILLGLFTVCQGFMLGTISTYYSVDAILIAVGITSAVAFCLTVFAFQTKIDFTNCGGTASNFISLNQSNIFKECFVHCW